MDVGFLVKGKVGNSIIGKPQHLICLQLKYFSSYWDTTCKRERRRHRDDISLIIQIDRPNWATIRNQVRGLPEVMPELPVRSSDPARDCQPDRPNQLSPFRGRSPLRREVAAAAVRQDQLVEKPKAGRALKIF